MILWELTETTPTTISTMEVTEIKYAILVVYVPVDLWYNMTRYFRY